VTRARYGRATLWGYAAAAVVFVGGTLATIGGYSATHNYEDTASRLRFEQRAAQASSVFEDRLDEQVHQIEAAVALFRASRSVEADEYSTFAHVLLARSDLRTLEWVPRVRLAERAAFESTLGAERTVTEWNGDKAPVRARDRDEYFPIYYVEPQDGNEIVLGFDLASEESRRDALTLARDTGQLAVAGPLRPLQDTSKATAYLLVLSFYRGVPVTVEQRRDALRGFIVGVLYPQDTLRHAMSYPASRDTSVEVTDGAYVVAEHGRYKEASVPDAAVPVHEVPLPFGPRNLLFRSWPSARSVRETWGLLPIFALLSGGVATASGTLYLAWLATAMQREREIRRALEDARQHYRTLVDRAPESILVLDPETMKFTDTNPAAESMLELSHEQFLRTGPADISPPLQPDGRPSGETAAALTHRAMAGEDVAFEWLFRDSKGKDVECEVRLGRISVNGKTLIRGSAIDVSERSRAEKRRRALVRELDHRVKNTLNTVLALAAQTAGTATTLDEFQRAFGGRVRALARAHEALAAQRWRGAGIDELATLVLGPYRTLDAERIRLAGPPTTLSAEAASALSMVLNELATNATKYGSLSIPHGHVDLSWSSRADGTMVLEWQELGGPMPAEQRPDGFGMRLIRGLVEHELGGTLSSERHSDGLGYRITWPPEHVVAPGNDGNENEDMPDESLARHGV